MPSSADDVGIMDGSGSGAQQQPDFFSDRCLPKPCLIFFLFGPYDNSWTTVFPYFLQKPHSHLGGINRPAHHLDATRSKQPIASMLNLHY